MKYKFKTRNGEFIIINANNLFSADWIAACYDPTATLFTITK